MARYLARRLLAIVPTLLTMTLITFVVMHAIPGSPFDPAAFGGNDLPPQVLATIEAKYGLDRPLPAQYLSFIAGLLLLAARATDGAGNIQPAGVPFNQKGYLMNAIDSVAVLIK
jgi:ABC-type dipeptide/oligopeptide/nickel transport system permease component